MEYLTPKAYLEESCQECGTCLSRCPLMKMPAVATYCSGCLQMFSTGLVLYRTGLPVYHLLELVGMALGETPETSHQSLGTRMPMGTLRNQSSKLLSRRRSLVPRSINTVTVTYRESRSAAPAMRAIEAYSCSTPRERNAVGVDAAALISQRIYGTGHLVPDIDSGS